MVLAEFASTGCPDWPARAAGDSSKFSTYTFGLDAGPDNLGLLGRVKRDLTDVANVAFLGQFCFMHQAHLSVHSMLA
eukprot:8796847-Pyramimonas_sp.AAC.1